jgi:hypothetical protein
VGRPPVVAQIGAFNALRVRSACLRAAAFLIWTSLEGATIGGNPVCHGNRGVPNSEMGRVSG